MSQNYCLSLRPGLKQLLTFIFIAVLTGLSLSAIAEGATQEDEFLPPEQAFRFSYKQLSDGTLKLHWDIADGYYLYEKRLKLINENKQTLSAVVFLTQAEEKNDPNFGLVQVFHHQLDIEALPDSKQLQLQLSYQGCSENGLCYPPQRKTLTIQPIAVTDSNSTVSVNSRSIPASDQSLAVAEDAGAIAAMLASAEGYWVILTFFILGLGLTFTPCVLPMIPILAGIIAGQGANITLRKGIGLSTAYVLGMSLTYTLAGVLVGYFGAKMNLQASLQSPVALIIFSSLFAALAMAMFGFYELQLPAFLRDRLDHMGQNSSGGKYTGVALMGLISALVVSPCVSAPLAGALVYISTTGDALLGGASLFALSLGMGVPLILVGAGGGKWLPRAGGWMVEVKAFFGVLLLGVAVSLLGRLLPGNVSILLWSLLVIVYAAHLGNFGQPESLSHWEKTRRGLAIALMTYGITLLLAGLAGHDDPLKPLAFVSASAQSEPEHENPLFTRYDSVQSMQAAIQTASAAGVPVVIDLYADWCASCKAMEREVFSHPGVQAFREKVTFIQLNMTANTPEQSTFLQQHGLFGPPSLLFYKANGQELTPARVQGELRPQQFIGQVNKLL
ncbi:protein-disulfide reductase DsbD [Oceanospirillum linum]|uniref:Thiol:disulfide interchange protein DsbD n=1 Tax=Oceanospirillum linum TaxID=966 RepID=A0A1T1H9S5_OCELI|nr:protein-disulfide reductase DsbD [Oceanospirillum linum]OOV86565.1 hypothetical protein BTA35_0211670 [Oceanospirillum linum]SEG29817.1 thiol:disulfide interchange protein DsbD [Oleiphilus messinensis]SMP26224.1 thiol:disulfide interchange protein DsbD [Oceanospirillum linum]